MKTDFECVWPEDDDLPPDSAMFNTDNVQQKEEKVKSITDRQDLQMERLPLEMAAFKP